MTESVSPSVAPASVRTTAVAISQNLPVDVLVCGGGVSGVMAAVAAARQGASVMLVERYGFLGGNATAGAVAQFNSWSTTSGRRVIGGLADEVVERLAAKGGALPHESFVMSTGHHMDRVSYAPELLKLVLDELVSEAGVLPLLHAQVLDVQREGRIVQAVFVMTKSGLLQVEPRVLVDTSGDIDALHRAGAAFLPLDEKDSLQPATMMFRFGPIDFDRFSALGLDEAQALSRQGYESGALARAALHASREPQSDDGWFNISRLAIDATDALALGRAEIEGRRQAWRAAEFLRSHVPGCGAGRLRAFATQVGIRETRRIAGDHVLTAEELLRPEPFVDQVALGAYPIDIHAAQGSGLVYEALGDDHFYRIPYRSLIPADLDNALVAGRGISATHAALAAVRVMTISMAVGQAVGTAAAMAVSAASQEASGTAAVQVRSVDVADLQARLRRDGACLAD